MKKLYDFLGVSNYKIITLLAGGFLGVVLIADRIGILKKIPLKVWDYTILGEVFVLAILLVLITFRVFYETFFLKTKKSNLFFVLLIIIWVTIMWLIVDNR